MKPSARVASLFIFLFFLSFNALQVYLILERIAEAKAKFASACSTSLLATLSDYNKLKVIDSASMPAHAWIVYGRENIELSQKDSQSVKLSTSLSTLAADTVEPLFIENVLNSVVFRTIDLGAIDSIFRKTLFSKNVRAGYRLDTITLTGKRIERQQIPIKWAQKRRKEYAYSTSPARLPYSSNTMIFAEVKADPAFTRNDLLWPMVAFASILVIGNTALIFVYKTIRRQKRTNELKTDFINNITHEMKTPITIASAGLEALEHHVPAAERTNFYLHTSKKQLHLLNEFVERIVDAAVQDVSDFTLKKERIDLRALFSELIQSRSLLQGKPVSFRLMGEGPVFIHGDRLHLETAFHNIIDNAIKYSGESVDITIDIVENSRDCTISVRDNGMGIPPQFVKNIFEKFFRVPQGDAQSIKGFGLGLYYVSSIVKKHSGHISVHSRLRSGTEFIITLPKDL
ncbi:MAG TPA: HAMP domain-containing sensor histidine kinase [Flavisolibacter sp.]|nr:HAMP domain-containing sensor histidine kinase [Flavisolibacter sp.]